MLVKEKLQMDRAGLIEHGAVTIAIFGDSVSHGALNGNYNYETVYWRRLQKKLNAFRDCIPVNMINASVGGTTAKNSLKRLEKQVLLHAPDLTIVSFGLNDVNGPKEDYLGALREIFTRVREAGSDLIFMTQNMMNTYVADDTPPQHIEYAHKTAEMQNSGKVDDYMASAIALAREMGVTVCDCYAEWKRLAESEDTTMLLVNRINHPIPEMHELFAERLYQLIIGEEDTDAKTDEGMFQG